MSHKAALQRLIPVELSGVFGADLTVEGDQLDLVQADIEAQRQTIITDIATLLPANDDRIKMVPVRWDVKKPFYVALAASMGYTIYIRDYTPAMSDWLCAGDEFIVEEPMIAFSAGYGAAGDTLAFFDYYLAWIWEVVVVAVPDTPPVPGLEQVLQDLKPAEIMLIFTYL